MFKKLGSLFTVAVLSLSTVALADLDFTPVKITSQQVETRNSPGVSLSTSNTVVLRGEINTDSVSKALMELMRIKETTVYLFLSSPGGSVPDGLNFIDGMRGLNKKIICVTDFSASMSFVILQACHERVVFNSSVIMQHVPSMGSRGQYPNFKSFVGLLDRITEQTDRAQARRMGITLESFRALTRNDLWLFGADAVTAKAADRVTVAQCSDEMLEKTISQVINVFGFTLRLTWSACPLITAPLSIDMPNSANGNRRVANELSRLVNFRQNIISSPEQYKYDSLGRVTSTDE